MAEKSRTITIRIPEDMAIQIKILAASQCITMKEMVKKIFTDYLTEQEKLEANK